jgi:inhibitor of KinA
MIYSRYGEDGIRILFGEYALDYEVNESVRRAYTLLKTTACPAIVDLIPSFRSCLIHFDRAQITAEALIAFLKETLDGVDRMDIPDPVIHDIPVQYGGEDGPDLAAVSAYTGLDPDAVIALHTGTVYTVFAVGFMPGFPYLGILDQRLYAPRLETPRVKVPKGSVGLAQLQTGIYPFDSPGGWQIIGKTEVSLFDFQKPPYSLLQIGDKVKFIRP